MYSLSEGNIPTTDFEHKVLLCQMHSVTMPIVHSTAAFLLATIHTDGIKCPSPAQANRSAFVFGIAHSPDVKFTQDFYLLNSCPSLQITLNLDSNDRLFMQGLKFVFICILIFKFYIVHSIASHDAIFCHQLGF